MDWQQAISLLIVGTTAFLFLRGKFRRRKFSFEKDTHCGCAKTQSLSAPRSIVFKARKGARNEIIVKQ